MWTTPFGSAVEPEVCTMTAASAGETSASAAARTSAGTPVSSSAHRVAHPGYGVADERDGPQIGGPQRWPAGRRGGPTAPAALR